MKTDETPAEKAKRLKLEGVCADIGKRIGGMLASAAREAGYPGRVGFALVTFDFGQGGHTAYISNAEREDFVKLLGELRDKLRGQ